MAFIKKTIFPIGTNKPGTNKIFLDGKVSNLMPPTQTKATYYERTKYIKSEISLPNQSVLSFNSEINTTLPGINNQQNSNGPTIYTLKLLFNNIANANTLVGDAANISNWNTFFDLPTNGNPFTSVVIIGNEVQLIGGSSVETKFQLFSDYEHLLEVNDSGALITLGDETFGGINGTSGLTSISAPNVTTTISENIVNYGVFGQCYNLVNVYLPNCINLGAVTFYNCNNLPQSGLTLSFDQITSIGDYTFCNCYLLITANFPLVTTVGFQAFNYCTGLVSISLPSLTTAEEESFGYCSSLTSITCPLLINIPSGCFAGLDLLTSISIPAAVTAGVNAFANSTALASINLPALTTADIGTFVGLPNLTTISLPNLTSIGDSVFGFCGNLTIISLPVCTSLGSSVGNNNVFENISSKTITLTVPNALMTCNGGNPDGDIQYLQANNTVTIVTV